MAEEKCRKCQYYEKIDDEHGNCHRYPPQIYGGGRNNDVYPSVLKNDNCGEYKEQVS